MNNFSIAQNATSTALNSSGSAMKEQEKYADSLEARINRLDTAWNKFTLSIGEAVLTDGLVGGIESLNDLATGVTALVDKFGLLSGVFGIIGVATIALSTKFRTFTASLLLGTQGMTRMQLASAGLTSGMSRLGIATVGVKTALRGLLASTVVGAVFVGIGFALEKLIGKYSEAKQEQEEFEASQQKGIDALAKNREETESLISQYNNLTEARKEMGKNWSVEQEERYLALQQQIGDMYPQLISYIDAAGNKHIKSKIQIEEEIKATEKLIATKKEELKLRALDNLTKVYDDRKDINDDLTTKQKQIEEARKSGFKGREFETAIAKAKTDVASLQQQWSQASQKITSEVLKVADAYIDLEIDQNIRQGVDEFVQSLDLSKLKPEQLEIYAKRIGETINALQTAYQTGDKIGFEKAKQSLSDYANKMGATKLQTNAFALSLDDVKKAAELGASAIFAGKDGVDGLDESMGNLVDSTMDVANAQGELSTAAERLVGASEDQISQIQEHIAAYQLLSQVENQSEDQKLMLAEATKYLANMYPHLVDGSNLNIEAMQLEAEQTDILLKAIDKMKQGHLSAEEQMTLATALNAKSRMNLLLQQAKAYESFARKLAQEADSLANSDFARSQDLEISARKMMGKATEGYKGFSKELEALMPDMDRWISQLAEATDYQGKNYQATDKSSSKLKDSIYVSDKFKQALELLNLEIEKQNKLQAKYPNYSQEYQDSVKKEISLMKQKKELIEAQTKALDQQIKSGKIAQTGMVKSAGASSTPAYSSSSSYASGGSTEAQIWNYFKSKGFSDAIVAGIMGNLRLESGLNPNAVNKSSGASGIAQWLGGRKTGLINYAKSMGKSWNDLQVQLDWLWKELNSSERKTLNWLQSNQGASAKTAAYEFDRLFERSEGTHRPQRANYANQYMSQFAGTGGGSYVTSGYVSPDNSAAESAQLVDQAKSDLLQLQQDALDLESLINDLEFELVRSRLAKFDREIAKSEARIKVMEMASGGYRDEIEAYDKELNNKINLNAQKAALYRDEIWNLAQKFGENSTQVSQLKDELDALWESIHEMNLQVLQNKLDNLMSEIDNQMGALERRLSTINSQINMTDPEDERRLLELQKQRLAILEEQRKQTEGNLDSHKKLQGELWGNREALLANTKEIEKWQQELENVNVEIYQQQKAINEIYENAADKYVDVMKEAYEAERDIKLKQIEEIQDADEKAHKERMKQYDSEMKKVDELYNKKLREIDDQESANDFNKELSKRQKEAQKIQDEINKLALDDSAWAKKRKQELEEELANKTEEINEFVNDRNVELRKQSLEDQREAEQNKLEQQRTAEEEAFEQRRLLREHETENINLYYENLLNNERYWSQVRQDILSGDIQKYKDQMGTIAQYIQENNQLIGESIANNITDSLSEATRGLDELRGSYQALMNTVNSANQQQSTQTSSPSSSSTSVAQSSPTSSGSGEINASGLPLRKKAGGFAAPNGGWNNSSVVDYLKSKGYYAEFEDRTALFGALGGSGSYVGSNTQNSWLLNKLKGVQGLKTGGYVDWDGQGGKLAFLHKKELVLNQSDTKNLLEMVDIARSFFSKIPKLQLPNLPQLATATTSGDTNIYVTIDKLGTDKNGVNGFFKAIEKGFKERGGKF